MSEERYKARQPMLRQTRCVVGVLALSISVLAPAWAQESEYTILPSLASQRKVFAPNASCQENDQYITKGSESPIITTCDTLIPDQLGVREWLRDRGFLFEGYYSAGEIGDVLSQGARPQQYNGQNPNFSGSLWLDLTYDLARLGFNKGTQLTLSMNNWQTAYTGAGIRGTALSQATVYMPFFDGHLTVQYGYYGMLGQFYGLFMGTSTASSALGPMSIIPNSVGMSMYIPTPGIDIRAYTPNMHYYNHFGLARSQSPEGFLADAEANPTGVNFRVNGASLIVVDEIGYRVRPSATAHMEWFRAGGIYNTSSYYDYSVNRYTRSNAAFYVAFDRQLIQTNPKIPHVGWYIDFKTDHADPAKNVFSDDYAFTIYSLGPFAGREQDMLSLGYSFNKFGTYARRYLQRDSATKFDNSMTGSVAYALHAMRGVYFVGTVAYTTHPIVSTYHAGALTMQGQFTLSF